MTVELVAGRTRDNYQRLLAYITLPDGAMLNRELVRQGYGYADSRYGHPHLKEFRQLMNEARKADRGLWKQARDEDLPYYLRRQPKPARR